MPEVKDKLEELKCDALSCRLGADEDGEVAEANVGVVDWADVLELEMHDAHLYLGGWGSLAWRRVESGLVRLAGSLGSQHGVVDLKDPLLGPGSGRGPLSSFCRTSGNWSRMKPTACLASKVRL